MIKKILYSIFALSFLASCAIENDIPYPQIVGSITAFEVEGQRGPEDNEDNAAAVIDANARTVTVYVNDSVDVRELKITRLALDPRDAALLVDSALCDDAEHFPFEHFASLDSIPVSSNTRVDFSNPVNMTIRTYQDYVWKVTVEQIIDRKVDVDGMTSCVIDPSTRNVIIYVGSDQDLSNITVKTLNLGGEFGEVTPNPADVHDFTTSQKFYARLNWEPEGQYSTWNVFVYHDEGGGSSTSNSDVFARVTSATLTGNIQSGKTPVVEYKEQSASDWQTVSDVSVSSTKFTANITGLSASTTYSYRVSVDGVAGAEKTFTTVAATPLENGGLENWSQDGIQWNPWAVDATPFWGTGNKGSSIIGANITTPVDESVSGKAALLASRYVVLKGLAAGNLFTGDFELKGMNGRITMGRDFSSFPSGLRLYLKYQTSKITQADDDHQNLKGQNDMCHIYFALTTEKVVIDTSLGDSFDQNASCVVAYGDFISSENVSGNEKNNYKQIDIDLTYKRTDVTPKYIIIVCSASRYGDFFTGGESSKLWIDEMELVYE